MHMRYDNGQISMPTMFQYRLRVMLMSASVYIPPTSKLLDAPRSTEERKEIYL